MIVDDEASLRRTSRRALERQGYVVLEARSAEDAITILQTRGSTVDLIVCDIALPGIGGLELIHKLSEQAQRPQFLLVSGFDAQEIEDQGGIPAGAGFLGKPYMFGDLLSRIRSMLDPRS